MYSEMSRPTFLGGGASTLQGGECSTKTRQDTVIMTVLTARKMPHRLGGNMGRGNQSLVDGPDGSCFVGHVIVPRAG